MSDRPNIISFCAHRGGTGRSAICVMTAEATTIYGENVAIVDFDFEAPGLLAMSTLKRPNPLFQPTNLYDINKKGASLLEGAGADNEVEIPGLAIACLKFFDHRGHLVSDLESAMDDFLQDLPIYEVRPPIAHPLEGRMFVVPLGGKFRRVEQIVTVENKPNLRTEWAYRPTSKKGSETEGKFEQIIHSGQIGEVIRTFDAQEINFFDALAVGIKHRVDAQVKESTAIRFNREKEVYVPGLDYIFFDQRPGFSGRTAHGASSSDGVVLVGLPSRSGAIGVASQLDDFRRSEEMYRDYLKTNAANTSDEGKASIQTDSRVVGVVLNALPVENGVSEAQESGLDAIKTNILESGLLERLSNPENAQYIALQKGLGGSYYRQNLFLLSHRYRPEARKFSDDDVERSGSEGSLSQNATEKLWRQTGLKADTAELARLSHIIPIGFDMNMRLYDTSVDIRHPYQIQNKRTSKGIADAIMLLAGHIIDTFPEQNKKKTVRTWLHSLRKGVNLSEAQLTPAEGDEKNMPWREHLRFILGRAWGETSPKILKELAADLDNVAEKQAAFLDTLIGGEIHRWERDWRILALKADFLSAAGESEDAEENYRIARQVIENWAQKYAPPDPSQKTKEFSDDILPTSMVSKNDLTVILTDMSAARGGSLANLGQWTDAWRAYKDAFVGISLGRRLPLIDDIRRFFTLWLRKGHEKNLLIQAIQDLNESEIKPYMENPGYGLAYKKRFADLSDMAFWIDAHALSDTERKTVLNNVAENADAWLRAVELDKLQSSDIEIARINSIAGRSKLILSLSQAAANSLQLVREAQEHLERSVNLDEENIIYHIELALVQELSVRQMYFDLQSKKASNPNEAGAMQLEQSIKMRSAFYSFEQTFALLVRPCDQDFFFDSDDAKKFSDNFLETLSALLDLIGEADLVNPNLVFELPRLEHSVARIAAFRPEKSQAEIDISLKETTSQEILAKLRKIHQSMQPTPEQV